MKSSTPLEKTKSISIIIPTLNEAENIGETLATACGVPGAEVIVVDGGSRDQTVEIARSFGVKVIDGPSGRARQMNVGASMASGGILLFLHGDTRLPKRFDDHVHRTMARPGVVAGAFQFSVDGDLFGLRIMERLVNLRSRRLQLPYGEIRQSF
jgi:glycosyltransferase involved in cell wall biosynthesis